MPFSAFMPGMSVLIEIHAAVFQLGNFAQSQSVER
jgi:hypothetical protein